VYKRGKAFFDIVYGQNSGKLMKIMDSSGTPDLGASGRLMYAYFLSNTNILSGKETMFLTMTGMIVTDVSAHLFIISFPVGHATFLHRLGSKYAYESHERRYKSRCHP
jgi:hypothetical protein